MAKPDWQALPKSRGFKAVWRFAKGSETLLVNIRATRHSDVEVWVFRDESGEPAEVHIVPEDLCEAWLLRMRTELLAEGWTATREGSTHDLPAGEQFPDVRTRW
jgi:hypothetical protein